jgi:hypothetical protein
MGHQKNTGVIAQIVTALQSITALLESVVLAVVTES